MGSKPSNDDIKLLQASQWAKASFTTAIITAGWMGLVWLTPFMFFVHHIIGCADFILSYSFALFTIPIAFAIVSLNKKWTKLGALMLQICTALFVLPFLIYVVIIVL